MRLEWATGMSVIGAHTFDQQSWAAMHSGSAHGIEQVLQIAVLSETNSVAEGSAPQKGVQQQRPAPEAQAPR